MEAEPKRAELRRPMVWGIVGLVIGAAGVSGLDRVVRAEPDRPKVVDVLCVPTTYASTNRLTGTGVVVLVYDDGRPEPRLDISDGSSGIVEANGLKVNLDLCIP